MDVLRELGDWVVGRWRAGSCDEASLPEIAVRAIESFRPHEHVDVEAVADFLLKPGGPAVRQRGPSDFAAPAVDVYVHDRMLIELLFWLEGTTDIHQHAFSGAFSVVRGGSLHARYDFHARDRVNARLLFGDLELRDAELLSPGDVRPIVGGDTLIHGLFHIEHPSISMVVRTFADAGAGPQLSYLRPGVAFDPFDVEPTVLKQIEYLQMLLGLAHPSAARRVLGYFEDADAYTAFRALHRLHGSLEETGLSDAVAATVARRHPTRAPHMLGVLEEGQRVNEIRRRRAAVRDFEHRFFLALLMNVPTRERILALVAERYPQDDPRDRLHRWLSELTQSGALGVELDEPQREVLRCMLEDPSEGSVARRLAEVYPTDEVDAQEEAIAQICQAIRGWPLVRPLFG